MIVKCRNREYDLDKKDVIATNGFGWWIETREYFHHWTHVNPEIAKAKAKKLVKDGLIVPVKTVGPVTYYKIKKGE